MNLLPHNHAIEVAVLGALLVDTDLAGVGELMDRMHVDLFHREHHAAVFSAMRAQWAESGIVDYRGVEARLRAERAHDHPADLLRQIAEQAAVLPAAAAYVGDLTDLHRRRRLIAQAERSAREAADLSAPVSGIVDNLLAGVSDSMDTGRRSSSSTRAESIRSHVEAIRSGAVDHGMDTGFHELDRIIGGMRRGHLLIVAARPSMGKSAFCLDVAVNATKASIPVAFFSLEMSSSDIAERLLAKSLRYSTDHLHTIPADDLAQLEQLDDAVSRAEADDDRARLYIEDRRGLTLETLRHKARRYVEGCGAGLIVVDYIGLMRTPKAENRNNEIAKLSAGLMELAHELNVPLLAASQLNRSVEGRHDKRPTLADLRDSGAIEQDAHVCMFIHRESYYARRDPALNYNASAPDEAEIIVSKNRCGRTGISKLAFRQDITTFYNIRHDDAWSGA